MKNKAEARMEERPVRDPRLFNEALDKAMRLLSVFRYEEPLTIAEAAAPDSSLKFALVGTVVLVPMILAYTAYSYWVFRGKVDPDEGYH